MDRTSRLHYPFTLDFLSVRKIPTEEHQYLEKDSTTASFGDDERLEDPMVSSFLSSIRKDLITDRSLHDKVYRSCVFLRLTVSRGIPGN